MFCANCGKKIESHDQFCPHCGKEIVVEKKTEKEKIMDYEKPRSFKLQKNVSANQYGWTALISFVVGIIFIGSLLGSILILVGLFSGIAWLFRVIKSKALKWILLIVLVLLGIPFFYGLFNGLMGK